MTHSLKCFHLLFYVCYLVYSSLWVMGLRSTFYKLFMTYNYVNVKCIYFIVKVSYTWHTQTIWGLFMKAREEVRISKLSHPSSGVTSIVWNTEAKETYVILHSSWSFQVLIAIANKKSK